MHYVQYGMASSDVLGNMEIKPELQEVEIETIPGDMQVDSVEGTQMIAFQSLHEPGGEEIILQTQEEIVGDGADDLNYEIPVPTETELDMEYGTTNFSKRSMSARRRQAALKAARFKNDYAYAEGSSKKWEQKQVQIKTLEGEFSVTMWSSGADDGKIRNVAFVLFADSSISSGRYGSRFIIPSTCQEFALVRESRKTTWELFVYILVGHV